MPPGAGSNEPTKEGSRSMPNEKVTVRLDVSESLKELFAEVGERLDKIEADQQDLRDRSKGLQAAIYAEGYLDDRVSKLEAAVKGKAPGRLAVVCAELQEQVGELTPRADRIDAAQGALEYLYGGHTARLDKMDRAISAGAEAADILYDAHTDRIEKLEERATKDEDGASYMFGCHKVWLEGHDSRIEKLEERVAELQGRGEGLWVKIDGAWHKYSDHCEVGIDHSRAGKDFADALSYLAAQKQPDEPRTVDEQGWDVPEAPSLAFDEAPDWDRIGEVWEKLGAPPCFTIYTNRAAKKPEPEYRVGDCVRFRCDHLEIQGVITTIVDPKDGYFGPYHVRVPDGGHYIKAEDILCRLVPEDGYDAK